MRDADVLAPTEDPAAGTVRLPALTPAPSGEGLIECLRFDAWRLLTISSSDGRLIRTWTALAPKGGTGPESVASFARVSDGQLLDLGYCGPVALLPGDSASVVVTASGSRIRVASTRPWARQQ